MTLERTLCITTSILKKRLTGSNISHIKISWSTGATIDVYINPISNRLTLSYNYRGEPIEYDVRIEYVDSNLGTGVIPYFICPVSGLRAKKLYSYGSMFVHRKETKGYYEKQLEGKKQRQINRVLLKFPMIDKIREQRKAKYYKPYYRGVETKKNKRLTKKMSECQIVVSNLDIKSIL